ncbi:hypothetical protein NQ314_015548 [Rhamnusium bicolor]|uniref:PiggyBac transposable element-derived protein domain-containing protein n=1 Tax=Rhamnusium bicolor TaxID=1586634 RepID=A0AAV8WXW1_9CUCU|nr:hypothetical protein NQ314_015548 [Rhamnusium bicolor]
MRRSISDTLCLKLEDILVHLSDSEYKFDKGQSDDEEANLEQEVREPILTMPIEFEDGLLLQNDVIEDIREIQKNQEGGEVNEEQTKDDGNQRTGEEEVLEQIARNPKKEAHELKERYKNILWRREASILDGNAVKFLGISSFPSEIENLSTPLAFFNYFFDKVLMSIIVDESNLFSTEKDQYFYVDEQLCATKGRHYIKQYLPAKPHKWRFKLYMLCGTVGFSCKFEIYTGDENNPKHRKPEEPDLGSSSNIVLRLCRNVPNNQNYRVYFDNFYASIPLAVHLAKCLCLGTMRSRIPNCKLPSDKEMAKEIRGTSQEFVAVIEGVEISSVVWKDNKIVTFISSFPWRNTTFTCEALR